MYILKNYDNVSEYTLRDEELIGLDFPKLTTNSIFSLKKVKDVFGVAIEKDVNNSCENFKSLITKYFKTQKDLLLKEFENIDFELFGLVSDNDIYILDICINDRFMYHEHLEKLSKKYNFKILDTIYEGKYDADTIEAINKTILIKSRWEKLSETTGTIKGRYVIVKEAIPEENEKEEEKQNDNK